MSITNRTLIRKLVCAMLCTTALLAARHAGAYEPVVPGTGVKITKVGDDFEDPTWMYYPNLPKSSKEIDEKVRGPAGKSKNGRWYEGAKRGTPDVAKRVATPAGGLPGSTGSLLLQTLHTGVPGKPSGELQQDDFIADCHYALKGAVPVSQTPSVVVRVFMPKVAEWENRTGPSFAFRVALLTHAMVEKEKKGFFNFGPKKEWGEEIYWPGFFVEFQSETDRNRKYDSAWLRVRANSRGGDFKGRQVEVTGWWTLGISITPDGAVHYYARPGIEDLTSADYITSQKPYGYTAEHFKTFFFNVCNNDNGKTWSTAWIIDDPTMYYIPSKAPQRISTRPVRKR